MASHDQIASNEAISIIKRAVEDARSKIGDAAEGQWFDGYKAALVRIKAYVERYAQQDGEGASALAGWTFSRMPNNLMFSGEISVESPAGNRCLVGYYHKEPAHSQRNVFFELAEALLSTTPQPVPAYAWEALQRLIENGGSLGPASRDDALVVARHRRELLTGTPSATEYSLPKGYSVRYDEAAGWHWYNDVEDHPAEGVYPSAADAAIGAWKDHSEQAVERATEWARQEYFTRELPDSSVVHVFNLLHEFAETYRAGAN